jgi:hypothetical protein
VDVLTHWTFRPNGRFDADSCTLKGKSGQNFFLICCQLKHADHRCILSFLSFDHFLPFFGPENPPQCKVRPEDFTLSNSYDEIVPIYFAPTWNGFACKIQELIARAKKRTIYSQLN